MNKLSRERVKNNFKWIYVQPTSSSPEIDGLGTVLNCVLFSFPHPVSDRTNCQRARKENTLHFAWWTPHCLSCSAPPVWWARTLVSACPGVGEGRARAARECASASCA